MSIRPLSLITALMMGMSDTANWGQQARIAKSQVLVTAKVKSPPPPKVRRRWWGGFDRHAVPLGGGPRECARRRRQIERGIATPGSVVFRKKLDGSAE